MRTKVILLMGMFLISSSIISQEIGRVVNGSQSVIVVKTNNRFECVYSDVGNSESFATQKSFIFPFNDSLYNIIIDGFESGRNHQTVVQTYEDTIIKFDYRSINGRIFLTFRHNNLKNNVIGTSISLTKGQIDKLFGKKD